MVDPRFKTAGDRARNQEQLYEVLVPIFKQRDAAEWIAIAARLSIPNSLINDLSEIVVQEQALARDAVIPIKGIENMRTSGIPIKLNRTPGQVRMAPPKVGEHTDETLASVGLDKAAIAALREERVVA